MARSGGRLRRRNLYQTTTRAHRHCTLLCTQRSRERARWRREYADHSVLDGDAVFRDDREAGWGTQPERRRQGYSRQAHHSGRKRCEWHPLRMRCGDSPDMHGYRSQQDHYGPNDSSWIGSDPLTVDLDGLGNCRAEWQNPGTCLRRSHERPVDPLDLAGALTAIRAPRRKAPHVRTPPRNARDFQGCRLVASLRCSAFSH